MNKRVVPLLCTILLTFLMLGNTAFAGDLPESALLHADYCFIGTVQNVGDTVITLKINEVVFGEFPYETVNIQKFKYVVANGKTASPKKGDYCAVAVKETNGIFNVYESLAARADSLDKKTLKLKSTSEFLVRMNHYINNGWYSNENIKRIRQRIESGKESPAGKTENKPVDSKPQTLKEETDSSNTYASPVAANPLENKVNYGFIGICAALIIIAGLMILKNFKRRKVKE